jgi:hypothetical protein
MYAPEFSRVVLILTIAHGLVLAGIVASVWWAAR